MKAAFLSALVALCCGCFSQSMPMGLTGKGMLLEIPEVRKELHISQSQQSKLKELMKRIQSGKDPESRNVDMFYTYKYIDSKVISVLDSKQNRRLFELFLQANGPLACTVEEVSSALKLSPPVITKIHEIDEKLMTDVMENLAKKEDKEDFDASELAKMNSVARKKILILFSPQQKKKWQVMQGKPFKFPKMRFN